MHASQDGEEYETISTNNDGTPSSNVIVTNITPRTATLEADYNGEKVMTMVMIEESTISDGYVSSVSISPEQSFLSTLGTTQSTQTANISPSSNSQQVTWSSSCNTYWRKYSSNNCSFRRHFISNSINR